MRRGDVYWVNFEPIKGSEANKKRPAVIVSNDHANAVAHGLGRGTVTVVSITSNTKFIAPFHILISAEESGLKLTSKAQAEHVRSVDVKRIGDYLGFLHSDTLQAVNNALRIHLSL